MTESLSLQEARKLALLSQKIPPRNQTGRAVGVTLKAIEHLGYVQIDTIAVIQRAHHHTLWNRNPRYKSSHLDELLDQKSIFEYWSHAAAYLPMRDFRFSLYRKQAITSGAENHWYKREEKVMRAVLERITAEGPLMAKDFEQDGRKRKSWESKPAKRALELLYMQGTLMVPSRVNFHKVYDLTERVLPPGVDTSTPDTNEYVRYLIASYLQANGLGREEEIGYLLKNIRPVIQTSLDDMVLGGELIKIRVGSADYYALPTSLELLKKPLARSKLKILSPFDNLIIQRKRMQALFGFSYTLECYLPKVKRQYGFFCLPVLFDGNLIARMDCQAERENEILHIHHLFLEPGFSKVDEFIAALVAELQAFLKFNGCRQVLLHSSSPSSILPLLRAAINKADQ